MKLLSLFSGIGAFEKALTNLNIPYELVGYSEIDKYASKSYAAIHNVSEDMNLGDITKINEKKLPKDIDVVTYGFPCQDISIGGKMNGLFNNDGTQTRSGLFFEALRIIEATQPKIAIAENVKNLMSKKFKPQFEIVLESLDEAGYNNHYQILKASDYGMPQARERVFIVSIRKDVDNGHFKFPEPFELKLTLKDMLDDEVDKKYYLSEKLKKCFLSDGTGKYPRRERFLQNLNRSNQHIANTLTTLEGNRATCTFIKFKKGVITTDDYEEYMTLRKLTPKECFRLMGFDDEDFEKVEKVNSNTQLYKQAGNSIVVDVLENIFNSLQICKII